jgi:ABC-type branched-subunit amino acid transport system substrate-binding protein
MKLARPKTRSIALLVSLGLLAAACSSGGSAGSKSGSKGPGVSGSTITVGTVADLSGIVPGLFAGAVNGAKAYADYINSKGGVNGKKIVVNSVDTGTSCIGAKQAAQGLTGKVLAFVGSFSVFDQCAGSVWQKSGDPVFMLPLSQEVKQLPNLYSPAPAPAGFYTGPARYFLSKHPGAIAHMAMLYGGQAKSSYEQLRAMYESLGGKVVYQRVVAPTETNYLGDIVTMRKKGVQWLDMTSTDVGTILRVAGAAAQQHWKPVIWTSAPAYDPHVAQQGQMGLLESVGVQMAQPFALFQGEDAATVPEVALLDEWYGKQSKGAKPDLFGMYGWASMALFVKSLQTVSGSVTQANLLTAVQSVHSFNANGLLPDSDVGAKKPPLCWVLVVAKNGKYVRQSPPSPTDGTFICDKASYFFAKT